MPAGEGWFVLNACDARWCTANDVARRYGPSPDEDTQDGDLASRRVPVSKPTRYRDGWLPG